MKILWVDDEIEMLKPHIIFLTTKGYEVEVATNGYDAIDMIKEQRFDIVFLDEHMPGITGLETLPLIKEQDDSIPVVMVTKSEEENLMEEALGSKIADYLIKPVRPSQMLLCLKKVLENQRLVSEKITTDYRQSFMELSDQINACEDIEDWKRLFVKLEKWEVELSDGGNNTMDEVLSMQMKEANQAFFKFVQRNYKDWHNAGIHNFSLNSVNAISKGVFPLLDESKKVFMLVIDNLRFDHWLALKDLIQTNYSVVREDVCCSILPTATMYARNSLFAGLTPNQIATLHPDCWVSEDEEGFKNLHEETLLHHQLERYKREERVQFIKASNATTGGKVMEHYSKIKQSDFSVLVINFIDMISHARTDMEMIKELASDEAAFRSLAKSWFEHSQLKELLEKLSEDNIHVVLTSDHGTTRVKNAVKIQGEKNTNTNLRYKLGRNLKYPSKNVYEINRPNDIGLPHPQVSTKYIFGKPSDYFVYKNNFSQFSSTYFDTFQHGGISLEEMLVPFVVLSPK
ncbi:PglZ domain-containing protein [Prolixibacteraceae bacterium]|nr:PglZ domain-containing protein [Prolixibacteraceae bacterium]